MTGYTATSIWAPHADDEIIGCFSVLNRQMTNVSVHFATGYEEAVWSAAHFSFERCKLDLSRSSWYTVYAPDPATDPHPLHQFIGQRAQQLFRERKIGRLLLYTTTMNATYISELSDVQKGKKHFALDKCYADKSSLWKYDHRYWLFEGHIEWHHPD